MYNLQKRAHKNLRVVGWFSTTSNGEMIAESTAVIQSYYTQQCLDHDCLHLAVDTSLSTDNLSLSAYVLTPLVAAGRSLANMFHEIKLTTFSTPTPFITLLLDRFTNFNIPSDQAVL